MWLEGWHPALRTIFFHPRLTRHHDLALTVLGIEQVNGELESVLGDETLPECLSGASALWAERRALIENKHRHCFGQVSNCPLTPTSFSGL